MGFLQALLGFQRSKDASKLADEHGQRMLRLTNPDWGFYEKHLQRPVPPALKRLFANASLVAYSGIPIESGEIYVTAFEPIDQEAVIDAVEWLGFAVVPFASSDGDLIYLRPGPLEADRVYITYHDGGDTEILVDSAEAFLAIVEVAVRNAI